MNYSEEEKRIIFHEWIQGILSSLKKFVINTGDEHAVTMVIADNESHKYEAVVEITVRLKQIEQEENS